MSRDTQWTTRTDRGSSITLRLTRPDTHSIVATQQEGRDREITAHVLLNAAELLELYEDLGALLEAIGRKPST